MGSARIRAKQAQVQVQVQAQTDAEGVAEAEEQTRGPSDFNSKRPYTRSQTGKPLKRRVREDNALDPDAPTSSSSSPPMKRARTSTTKKRNVGSPTRRRAAKKPVYSDQGEEDAEGDSDTEVERETSAPTSHHAATASTPSPSAPEPVAGQPQTSTQSLPVLYGTTKPMRATLPTPVPNLTKKSRGRRVPVIVNMNGNQDSNAGKRAYVCSVEGCGKCFHRGEHLKRHIRSIHTYEKPFKCTFPDCEKYFNRHDNLLQHVKVHRQQQAISPSPEPTTPPLPRRTTSSSSSYSNPLLSLAAAAAHPLKSSPTLPNLANHSPSDTETIYSSTSTLATSSSQASLFPQLRQTYSQMCFSPPVGRTIYDSANESTSFSSRSGMNVSSLRTEMPERKMEMDFVKKTVDC
ncbi:hypothetical protein Moror_4577 [Moniliophthora roreri MCA 2997]|uniref:C2H2-type domain-containing protein n=2 Tax=Moniliophthora roreri TaxID=221103 RepID=V2XIR0_MONRO|nr:hypothetical protein Moror_4577 [Moniliophthora roreri MCA 2997]KAI3595783.1 hypothetical protein WG66_001022 [Moniliophthora roreri]